MGEFRDDEIFFLEPESSPLADMNLPQASPEKFAWMNDERVPRTFKWLATLGFGVHSDEDACPECGGELHGRDDGDGPDGGQWLVCEDCEWAVQAVFAEIPPWPR